MKVWIKAVQLLAGLALLAGSALAQKVTLNFWTQGAGGDAAVFERMVREFQKEYPDIDVKVQVISDYQNALTLAFRGGNPPDVFRSNLPVPLASLVKNGWLLPLDRFVSVDMIRRFPQGSLAGLRVEGQLYSLPFFGALGHTNFLFYNKKIFAEAGISTPPRSYAEFRAAARKITEVGKGRYYGFAITGAQGTAMPCAWASVAGFPGDIVNCRNYQTGRANADHPAVVNAVNLLKAMNLEDKSFLPGWETMNIRQMAEAFVAGKVGMFQTSWTAMGNAEQAGFKADDYGIAPLPTPDGRPMTKASVGAYQGFYSIAATTKHPREAWLWFNYLYSDEGLLAQTAGGLPPGVPAARVNLEQLAKVSYGAGQLAAVARAQVIQGPDPILRSPDWAMVNANLRVSLANFFNMNTSAIAGRIDFLEGARRWNAEYDAAMDAAIEAARKEGAKVCREMLIFPNFNGTKNFLPADYNSLARCP